MGIAEFNNQLEIYLRDRLRSAKTITSYTYEIKKYTELHPAYVHYEFKDIAEFFSEINQRHRRDDGKITGSVIRIFAAVKWLYAFLIHTGQRESHPFPPSYSIKGTQMRGIHRKDILTLQEMQDLLQYVQKEKLRFSALQTRNAVVISLLVHQAVQVSELINLTMDDVDLDEGTVYIRRSLTANSRKLVLHPSQILLFHTYITQDRPRLLHEDSAFETLQKQFVVGTRSAGGQDIVNSILSKYKLIVSGKPLTATNIRKSVIYHQLNTHGKTIEYVQHFAGHRWPSSTQCYQNVVDYDDVAYVNQIHPLEILL